MTTFYLFLYIVQFQVGNTPSPDLSGEKHEDEAEPLPGLIAVKKKAKKKAKHYKVSQSKKDTKKSVPIKKDLEGYYEPGLLDGIQQRGRHSDVQPLHEDGIL